MDEGWSEAEPRRNEARRALAAELGALLNGRFPPQNSHRNTVRTIKVRLHLLQQIIVGIELQMVIEPFLVISVASLHFTVVPRGSGAYCFVRNAKIIEERIEVMHTFGFGCVVKFASVIRLYRFRSVTKVSNSSLHEIYGRITALLSVGIYKTLSCSLINHCVLVKFLPIFARITSSRHNFNVKLPLDAENGGGIIRLAVLALFLCGFNFFLNPRRTKTR